MNLKVFDQLLLCSKYHNKLFNFIFLTIQIRAMSIDRLLLQEEVVIGAHSTGETPVLIPNTEAKPSSGDNTLLGEGSTAPNYRIRRPSRSPFLFQSRNFRGVIANITRSIFTLT